MSIFVDGVFNVSPNAFSDVNPMFPVLDDTVGLTSSQFKAIVDNTYYLYNHLGLADVEVGTVTTNFIEPGTLSSVSIVHRDVEEAGKTVDYFDYVFNIPTPSVSSSATAKSVENSQPAAVSVVPTSILNGDGVVVGYNFGFNFDIPKGEKGEKGDKGDKGDSGDGAMIRISGTPVEVVDFNSDPQSQISNLNAKFGNYATIENLNTAIQNAILDSWEASY